jgi:hypothetical protein
MGNTCEEGMQIIGSPGKQPISRARSGSTCRWKLPLGVVRPAFKPRRLVAKGRRTFKNTGRALRGGREMWHAEPDDRASTNIL